MKALWVIILVPVICVLAFFLHVPAFKYVSALGVPKDAESYQNLADGVVGAGFEIAPIAYGYVDEVYYNPQAKTYLMAAQLFDQPDPEAYAEWQLLVLDARGKLVESRGVRREDVQGLSQDPNLQKVASLTEVSRVYPYDFAKVEAVDLVHYHKQEFTNWPGFFYFIPVIYTDWKGVAFVKVQYQGAELKLQIPTDYSGGFLYLDHNIDGRIFVATHDGETPGLGFLWVGESYYFQGGDGVEIHREGFGFYVIRPR